MASLQLSCVSMPRVAAALPTLSPQAKADLERTALAPAGDKHAGDYGSASDRKLTTRIAEEEIQDLVPMATAFKLTNAVLGMGLLALPSAFRLCGWCAAGVFILLGIVGGWTSILIIKCLDMADDLVPEKDRDGELLDWPIIGQAAWGSFGSRLVKIVFLSELYLMCLSYNVLNAENLGVIFPWAHAAHLIIASSMIFFVMLLYPQDYLALISAIGVLTSSFVMIAVSISGACSHISFYITHIFIYIYIYIYL